MAQGPETKLVGHIRTAIEKKWPDAWVEKIHGGQYQVVGIPDLIVLVEGRFVGLEVKAQRAGESVAHARNRATPTQLAMLDRIVRGGGVGAVVLTVAEALDVISEALDGKQ